MDTEERFLRVERTARYCLRRAVGRPRELWYLLHGYAQLADGFLTEFETLDDGTRTLVAPEGLSRFYRRGTGGDVAASWMTKLARESEIADYLAWLDAVHRDVRAELGDLPVVVLGFSQGAVAAARWAVHGAVEPRRLILWGSGLAPELLTEGERLAGMDLTFMLGREDPWITPERVDEELGRLEERRIAYRALRFDGGHEITATALAELLRG